MAQFDLHDFRTFPNLGKMHLERKEISPHDKASHDQVLRQNPIGFDSNMSQQYNRVFFNFIQSQFIAVRVKMNPLFDGNFSGNPKPASDQLECIVQDPCTVIFPFVFFRPVSPGRQVEICLLQLSRIRIDKDDGAFPADCIQLNQVGKRREL